MARIGKGDFVAEAYEIRDGSIQLYKRFENGKASRNWYALFKENKGRRESLKTPNKETAEKNAIKRNQELHDLMDKGLPPNRYTFEKARKDYIKFLEQRHDAGNYTLKELKMAGRMIEVFKREFDNLGLHQITAGKIRDVFTKTDIPDSVQYKMCSHLKGLFSFAVRNERIRPSEVPNIEYPTMDFSRRGCPEPEEYNEIIQKLYENANNLYATDGKKISKRAYYYKWFSFFFVQFLALTGSRPREAINVKWSYISYKSLQDTRPFGVKDFWDSKIFEPQDDKEYEVSYNFEWMDYNKEEMDSFAYEDYKLTTLIHLPRQITKTKKERTALGETQLASLLAWWEIFLGYAMGWHIRASSPMPQKDDLEYVFPDFTGKQMREGKGGITLMPFDNVIEKIFPLEDRGKKKPVPVDRQGNQITLYSMRHFCITQRIYAGWASALIADCVGNSEPVLRRHYAHIYSARTADMALKLEELPYRQPQLPKPQLKLPAPESP